MLNERLRSLRENKNLTQKDASVIFDMSRERYNQYETGKRKPDYDTLISFAKYFKVSTDYLLGNSNILLPENNNVSEIYSTVSEKKIVKIFQRLKTDKFKEKAIIQFETYVDTLAELEAEFEELEETGSVKPDSVPSTQ